MTSFDAKVIEDIPAHRFVMLGGIGRDGDEAEGWHTVYLLPAEPGIMPDMISTRDLVAGETVRVTITGAPVWRVEAAEAVPAGTLVQVAADGRAKNYRPADGSYVGYTTHSAEPGEIVEIVRKAD